MRHYLASLVFFLLYSIVSMGQDWKVIVEDIRETIMRSESTSTMSTLDKIAGTPFLNDDFVNGSIVTTDSLMYKNIPMRYNIFSDEMEFLVSNSNAPRVIGNPRSFLFFYIEDHIFTYLTFTESNRPRQGFFEVFNRGECVVLMKRRTVFDEAEEARGYSNPQPARFVERPNLYYLKFGRKIPVEVSLRRRNILKAFEDKQDEIGNFVKDNNLSYRSFEDLIKMADYYNHLIAKSNY